MPVLVSLRQQSALRGFSSNLCHFPSNLVAAYNHTLTTVNAYTVSWVGLLDWSFTATQLQFVFAAYDYTNGLPLAYSGYGDIFPAATITQTITLSDEYDIGDNQSDAEALLTGCSFDSLNWGQTGVVTYNADGSFQVTVESNLGSTGSVNSTCSGTPATAADGYGHTQVSNDGWTWSFAKAQVDVCGQYCLRTFYCQRSPQVIDCISGSVDGYGPVTINPRAIDQAAGDSNVYTWLFVNCQCT